jgi:hypothetical protein
VIARGSVICLTALTGLAASAGAQGPTLPANDFEALLALTGGQFVEPTGPLQNLPSALKPVPPAKCGKGSDPLEEDVHGRVSPESIASPGADDGWRCNITLVGQSGATPGRFRTWRYVDRAGHTCAFYDSTLTAPGTVPSAGGGPSHGVVVLDMTDPSKPVETMRLTSQAMLSPHESLNLHATRGLLGAVAGNALTRPGQLEIYDVGADCRRPVLLGTLPTEFGHESGFSPDGKTFWTAGGGGRVLAVDVTNPKLPAVVWSGNMYSHGLSFSADGNTLYQTDPINGNLGILDVSEVQARKPDPQVREISRVTWDTVAIPQNSQELVIGGRTYLLEFDEFAFRFNPATVDHKVGGVRLIDLADPRKPKIASDIRLEVNSPELHEEYSGDPGGGMGNTALAYSAHYCAAPRRVDPEIVACSFMNSGLRVFDIRDPKKPKEVAYYVAPPKAGPGARTEDGNITFSQPSFDPARREVWYADAVSGFYALRLDKSAWPNPLPCTRKRSIAIRAPKGMRSVRIRYAGRTARLVRRGGHLVARIKLRRFQGRTLVVKISGRTRGGEKRTIVRRIRVCRK